MRICGTCVSCILLAIIATTTAALGETAVDSKPALSTKVKAAYLLNFARFSTWPDDAFEDTDAASAPFVIVVLGDDDAGITATLSALVKNEKVHNRSVVVKRLAYPNEKDSRQHVESMNELKDRLQTAHMLYIDESLQEEVASILELIDNKGLLTTSDCSNFAADGGMLGFIEKDGKIVFQANPKAIESSDVEVSSKVLRLAETVEAGK